MSRLDDLTDRLNPMLVKEARQILKSRFFAASFLIVLGVAWFLAVGSPLVRGAGETGTVGRDLFLTYYLLLAAALCIPVPLAAMHSFAFENRDAALEMLRVSPLSARQIVFGKLQVAWLHAGLYLAALVPFMSFAYLLRGISLLQIFGLTLEVVVVSTTLAMFALWMGLLSRTATRQLLGTLALAAAIAVGFLTSAVLGEAADAGAGLCVLVLALMGFAICRESAIVCTRPVPLRSTTLFIDVRRMERLIPLVREVVGQIRQHFPLTGQPLPVATTVTFRVAHRQIMTQFVKLSHVICPWPELYDRWDFVSYESTEPLLRQIRRDLLQLIFGYGWAAGQTTILPYERELQVRPWPRFPDTDPQTLDRLDAAAAELERQLVLLHAPFPHHERKPASYVSA